MKLKKKKVKVFVDGVDWLYEIEHCSDGNKIYPSMESLKKHNSCWKGCGIVECEIVFKKWAEEQNLNNMFKNSKKYSIKELEKNVDLIKLEGAKKHLEYLEELVTKQKHKVVELKVNLRKKDKQ